MTEHEFDDWLDYHMAAFPSLRGWFAKNTPNDAVGDQRPLAHWRNALRDVDLEDAQRATDSMLAGDLDEPRAYSAIPKTIRQWCRGSYAVQKKSSSKQRRTVDGEIVYDCPHCLDMGTIPVIHPKVHQQIYQGVEYADLRWWTCVVACTCGAGEKWRRECVLPSGNVRHALPSFDGTRMYAVGGGILSEDDRVHFWDWIQTEDEAAESSPRMSQRELITH